METNCIRAGIKYLSVYLSDWEPSKLMKTRCKNNEGSTYYFVVKRGLLGALTRILKTGVPEPSLPNSGGPIIQKNIASLKK